MKNIIQLALPLFWVLATSFTCLTGQNLPLDPPRDWAVDFGGNNFDFITDVVLDSSGGAIVTGYSNSNNLPLSLTAYAGSGYDVFVARYDSLGNLLWAATYGGPGDDFGNAIALDETGNLLVGGRSSATPGWMTDTTQKGDQEDVLVMKLDPNGAVIWAKMVGSALDDEAWGVATGPDGSVWLTGSAGGDDFPVTDSTHSGSGEDAFVLKMGANGLIDWALTYGGISFDKGFDVGVDSAGSGYICGETGSFDFPQTHSTWSGGGGGKAFVARFDSSGSREWALKYGGSNVERARSLHLPDWGGVVMTGYSTSPDFPVSTLASHGGGADAILVGLDVNGNRTFATLIGGSQDDRGIDLGSDADGNLFLLGETQSLDFPATNPNLAGNLHDQFLAKFSGTGTYQWGFPYGGALDDFSGGLKVNANHQLYFGGHTQSVNYPLTDSATAGSTARGTLVKVNDCVGQMADFSISNACTNDSVLFLNNSAEGTSDTLAFRWWFGDGDSSDAASPFHVYTAPGAYSVTLRITSPCGIDSFTVQSIEIYPNPEVDFGVSIPCPGVAAQFTDSSSVDTIFGSELLTWDWDFGNGQTSTDQHPLAVFDSSGKFQVSLSVTSNQGCETGYSDSITVYPKPIAAFGVADHCEGDSAWFMDSSAVASGHISNWQWDFGDGNSSAVPSPVHLYAQADTFFVGLIVNSDRGCADTASHSVIALPRPRPAFGFDEVCFPGSTNFRDSTELIGDTLSSLIWQYGDGNIDTSLVDPTHTYGAAGSYPVTLWAISASGCSDSILDSVWVHPKPEAAFSVENVCLGARIEITDSSSVSWGNIVAYFYDLGDSMGVSSASDTTYEYGSPGTFTIEQQIITDQGCMDTAMVDVEIFPLPQPDIQIGGAPDLCQGDTVRLFEPQPFAQYLWSNGDTLPEIRVFESDGFQILNVVDSMGCEGVDSIETHFHNVPRPNAVILPGPTVSACANDSLFLDAGDAYAAYLWNDGYTTAIRYVDQPGTYSVLVYNGFGCSDTSEAVTVDFLAPPAQPTVTQVGDTLFSSPASSYQWFDGGTAIPLANDPWYLPSSSGRYWVLVSDSNGCGAASDTLDVTVGREELIAQSVAVFPNPFISQFMVSGRFPGGEEVEISITDLYGKRVYTELAYHTGGKFELIIEASKWASGLYLLSVSGSKTQRIWKR